MECIYSTVIREYSFHCEGDHLCIEFIYISFKIIC